MTNVLGPFRLTKALLGSLAASAREGRGSVVLNISSDAAVNAYARWGAYGASKAALAHMTRIWNEEMSSQGVKLLALDPGDMDTPMHALGRAGCRPHDAEAAGRSRSRACRCDCGSAAHDAIAGGEAGIVIAADKPVQRSVDSKLLHVDAAGRIRSVPRSSLIDLLRPGDVVVANDAATLPASLRGVHVQTGAEVEVRLAARGLARC